MRNLKIAKKRIAEKGLTLAVAKNEKIIFETGSHGISGFLEAIEKLGNSLKHASVADKVVGKAIALLCIQTEIKTVYAVTLSKTAKNLFENYSIYHEWSNLVEGILNINKTEICPFEKLALEISDPNVAYDRFKALQSSLKSSR